MQRSIMEKKWCFPGSLQELENNEYINENERRRDVIRKSCNGTDYVIYGIENQSTVDEHMPIRILNYDSMHYVKEADQHRGKVHPVISIVFYTGKRKWNKSLRLKDCIAYPEELESFIPDYTVHLVQIMDNYTFQSKTLKDIFNLVKCIYNKDTIDERFKNINIENIQIAGKLTNTPYLENYEGEGEINMCREWDERVEEIKKEAAQEAAQEATQKGEEKKECLMIQKASRKLSIQEIADLFDFDVSYVQKVLNH